jgi:hypothetical protein
MSYKLRLRWNELLNKSLDRDSIMLDDIDATSKWIEDTHSIEFDLEYDIDDSVCIDLDMDPLLGVGVAPGTTVPVTRQVAHASISTITVVADVPEQSDDFKDFELDLVVRAKDPTSISGDKFDG